MDQYAHHSTGLTYQLRLITLFIIIAICHGWQPPQPRRIGMGLQTLSSSLQLNMKETEEDIPSSSPSPSRREFMESAAWLSAVFSGLGSIRSADARNLPISNGADTSHTGTVDALKPIVLLRYSLSDLKLQLKNKLTLDLEGMPTTEAAFKRIFDAYSDPVSYKQKYLDQNAFLVYYTKGFDGPGRPNIEEDDGQEKQTLQFGTRNEAWINWENFLVELKFVGEQDNDALKYLDETLRNVDYYLKLAPPEDMREAKKAVDKNW